MDRHPIGLGNVVQERHPHGNKTGRLEGGVDGLSAWVTDAQPEPLLPCAYIQIRVESVPCCAGRRMANRRKGISGKSITTRVPPTCGSMETSPSR